MLRKEKRVSLNKYGIRNNTYQTGVKLLCDELVDALKRLKYFFLLVKRDWKNQGAREEFHPGAERKLTQSRIKKGGGQNEKNKEEFHIIQAIDLMFKNPKNSNKLIVDPPDGIHFLQIQFISKQ